MSPPANRALRVLLLGPYPPPWGGVQTNLVALREFLRQRGVPCAAINLTRHRLADADNIYYPGSPAEVLRLIVRLRYAVTHLHIGGELSTRLLLLGLVCSMLPWTKVVLTFHSGGYPTSPQGRRARRASLRGFVLRRFDRHIAVNQELVDLFQRFGCTRDQVRLIAPHGMPVGFDEGLSDGEIPPGVGQFATAHAPLLVSVSGLEPEYDIPLQIDALGELRRTHPNAGLMIVGSGSQESCLRTMLGCASHRAHVLLTGDLPHRVALSLVKRADLFLRTTLYDGDAVSVRESLWLGTPTIATDNGMRPPGVRLVPIHDLPALISAISEQLAAAGDRRRRTESSPTPDAMGEGNLEETLRLYREMVS